VNLLAEGLWVRREFEDISQGLSDAAMRDHVDMVQHQTIIDAAQAERCERLTKSKLELLVRIFINYAVYHHGVY